MIERPDGTVLRLIVQNEFMEGMGMYYSGYIAKQHREKEGAAGVPMFLAQSSLKPFLENNLDVLQFELFEYITEGGQLAKGIPARVGATGAWGYQEDGQLRTTAVLKIPLVDSRQQPLM